MNPKLNFSYFYNKLRFNEYTTIRRKNTLYLYKIGDIFDISIDHKIDHQAILIKKEIKSIHDLPLDFLKKDCEYDDFSIEHKEDFIALLNTFWTGDKTINDEYEPLTVLYLQKLKK